MPYRNDSNTGLPGTAPNQFAQVGMGGSQGGGQFEQGESASGSLQSGQGGTSAEQEVFGSDTDGNASRDPGRPSGQAGDLDRPEGSSQLEQGQPRAHHDDEEEHARERLDRQRNEGNSSF